MLPWLGSGLGLLRDPTAFFQRCRDSVGETFVVDAFGYRLLCVFSAEGVRNLWAVPEEEASKGLADFALLRHKVPDDLFLGRRTFPHGLFGRDNAPVYADNLRQAVQVELEGLGDTGTVEIFSFTRRLAHRVGLASWAGPQAASARYLPRLAAALDRLDSSESFVYPAKAFVTVLGRKRGERRALAEIEMLFDEILSDEILPDEILPGTDTVIAAPLFERICAAWADVAGAERRRGIARDIVLVHMGSQSNLFAAIGWTLVNILERPELLERVRNGDRELLQRCGHESIRLAQRSIVLRQVLKPMELSDEATSYRVDPGVFLATMMSVTNTSAAEGLAEFNPDNYPTARFAQSDRLPARELVTTFGHGRHSCPAQSFSIEAICQAVGALLQDFDLQPLYRPPQPLRRQIGGVARADRPCPLRYRRRV